MGKAMRIEADVNTSLFVRDQDTGRLVFNSKAIRALGVNPAELAKRGYPLDIEIDSLPIVSEGPPIAG
jgi:hypothetical protein